MIIIFITLFTFLAVAILTSYILYPILTKRTIIQERLDALGQKESTARPSIVDTRTPWQELLAQIGEKIRIAPKEKSKYSKMLIAAGMRKGSVSIFLGIKLLLACLLPLPFIFFYAFPRGELLRVDSLLYIVALAICGFLLPSFWLHRKVEYRKTEIFHTLPDVLDLLTVCVEAGLGLDAALVRASENPVFKGNPLAEEIKIASMETRAGKPRSEALRDIAERTMVDDVKSFVTMLVQTERFGTSLSLALRVYSDSLRTKRKQIAEESAAKTAIKILFPLAFFIFPALMVVIIGPAFYKILGIFK
jgi:tight adherence protein C